MPGERAAVVTNVVAAVVGVAVVLVLVLLGGADASFGTTDRDRPPVPPAADPRSVAALRDAGDPAPTLATPSPPPAGEPRACTNADLDVAVDDLVDDGPRRRLAVTWRNGASTTCRLDGYPVVDLLGPAAPPFGYSRYGSDLIATRDDAPARPVDLGSGESARTIVTWTAPGPAAPARGSVIWTPDRIVVAFPGQGGNQSLPWRFGPVLATTRADVPSDVSYGPVVSE